MKVEWGEAKGFYWTPLLEDIGNLLIERKKERFLVASLQGLIAYGVGEEEDLQNISDNDEKFARKLSAKGVPDAICDLLFEKYVATKKRRASDESDGSINFLRGVFDAKGFNTLKSNGIDIDKRYLKRESLVAKVIEETFKHEFYVIGSPPATGKTSLLQLVMVKLAAFKKTKVAYMRGLRGGSGAMYSELESVSGVNLSDVEKTAAALENYDHVWVLIDDAQNAYNEESDQFWEELVKARGIRLGPCASKVRFIVAATYYLRTQGSPVVFAVEARLPPSELAMTEEEADDVYANAAGENEWGGWVRFKTDLKAISNHHIGVFNQGLRLVQEESVSVRSRSRNSLTEEIVINLLRTDKLLGKLDRCFAHPGDIDLIHRSIILDTIIRGEIRVATTGDAIEVDEVVSGSNQVGSIVHMLQRGGILAPGGQFTCLAAEWYYYNRIFPDRALNSPCSIEIMVMNSVSSMSATRLRVACNNGGFPKEAAFQQLFNEAMSRQLPRHNTIIPELNTKAIINGKEVTGEVDFYINGELQWALELLRQGSMITKHILRFQGKYRHVAPKAFLVVDCRGPKTRSVQRMEERCTLYFSEDFKSCICAMRGEPEVLLQLQE